MIDAYIWIAVWVVILIMCIVELGKVESRLAEDRTNKMFEYLKERKGEKMARYIDADALWTQMGEFHEKRAEEANMTGDRVVCVTWHDAVVFIKNAPTADVRENVHAKWLPYEFGNERWHKCSACGIADEYINERGVEAVRKFCPNCGAEMEM